MTVVYWVSCDRTAVTWYLGLSQQPNTEHANHAAAHTRGYASAHELGKVCDTSMCSKITVD